MIITSSSIITINTFNGVVIMFDDAIMFDAIISITLTIIIIREFKDVLCLRMW